jgi:DHA1 family tetracycline resistance protein-like MFS transporter
MLAIFLVVFVSMLGTSLLAPLIPFYAANLGVTPEYITLIMALYALCQFLAAPLWGRISDSWGRKPVLMLTVAGTAVGFIMLGFADSIWMLILARVVGGISAGNLSAAYAYVSDITTPENRAAGLGKIGAAFGLGFVLGPAIGGYLAGGDTALDANFQRPAFAAAAMSVAALIITAIVMREKPRATGAAAKVPSRISLNPFARFGVIAHNPNLLMTIGLMLLLTIAASVRESTVALWAHDHFSFDAREIGLLFAYTGAVITVFQGAAMGVLSKRMGDANLLIFGIAVYAAGLTCFVFADNAALLIIGTTLNSFGTAVFSNAPATISSKLAQPNERGMVLGINQSAGSLGRFIGPTFAGTLYSYVSITAPFVAGIVGMIVGLGVAWMLRQRLKAAAHT